MIEDNMARIVVYSKQHLININTIDENKVILSQPSIVSLPYSKEDIVSIEYVGTQAILHFKNGEQLILENFFNTEGAPLHNIVLNNPTGYYDLMLLNEEGGIIQYNPIANLTQVISVPTWISQAQLNVMSSESQAEPWYQSSLMKTGLAVIAAEAIYLAAFKKDDKKSEADLDITPPTAPKSMLDAEGKKIIGQADAGAKIIVLDLNNTVLGQAYADVTGSYSFVLSREIINGEQIVIYAEDQAGNKSSPITLTGNKDTIAPIITSAQISATGADVSGKAEAKAKIYIYAEDGTTLLAGPAVVSSGGIFSLSITPPLALNTKAKVMAVDEAGNTSKVYDIIVGQDTIPPEQPSLEVSQDGMSIMGIKGEAGAKAQIRDTNNKVIAETTIVADGRFELKLDQPIVEKDQWVLVVVDTAGNSSDSIYLKPSLDTIAPNKVQASVDNTGLKVTGTAEANSTIEIRMDNGVIGTGKADVNGKFEITLTSMLENNKTANIIAYDAAKNASSPLEIVGTKDTIQPNKVVLSSVSHDEGEKPLNIAANSETTDLTPKFQGKGEAGATVTIYDHGIVIGTTIVDANSTWAFTPNALSVGHHSITLSQRDAANNSSDLSDTFTFTIVNPTSATAFSLNDVLHNDEISEVDALLAQFSSSKASTSAESLLKTNQLEQIPSASPLYDDLMSAPIIIG